MYDSWVFGHFGSFTYYSAIFELKQKEVKFCSMVISSTWNFFEDCLYCYVCFLIFNNFWALYVMFGNFRENKKISKGCFILIRRDILSSLMQVNQKNWGIFAEFEFFLTFHPFWGIYIIFDNFWMVMKRSKLWFSFSSQYSKISGISPKNFATIFKLFMSVCFFIILSFWDIYVIFDHFLVVTK